MIRVIIDVNGKTIDNIHIVNRGPIGGIYADGDHEGGDGVRRYEWTSINGGSGEVQHARGDGAHALVARVLDAARGADRARLDGES